MSTFQRFQEIEAWRTARELTRRIYAISGKGAFGNDFGLRDQIRRASVSIMSNIAEGFESRTRRLFINYLGCAKASAGEVRSQLYAALDGGYISNSVFSDLYDLAEKAGAQISQLSVYLKGVERLNKGVERLNVKR